MTTQQERATTFERLKDIKDHYGAGSSHALQYIKRERALAETLKSTVEEIGLEAAGFAPDVYQASKIISAAHASFDALKSGVNGAVGDNFEMQDKAGQISPDFVVPTPSLFNATEYTLSDYARQGKAFIVNPDYPQILKLVISEISKIADPDERGGVLDTTVQQATINVLKTLISNDVGSVVPKTQGATDTDMANRMFRIIEAKDGISQKEYNAPVTKIVMRLFHAENIDSSEFVAVMSKWSAETHLDVAESFSERRSPLSNAILGQWRDLYKSAVNELTLGYLHVERRIAQAFCDCTQISPGSEKTVYSDSLLTASEMVAESQERLMKMRRQNAPGFIIAS